MIVNDMSRVKAQDKYSAILEAAIAVFAERGFWDTPTSLISKTAGVADGTLFNYFETKDDLINEVYLTLKRDLAHEMMDGFSNYETVEEKMRHIWNGYTRWGVENPDKFKVLQQIGSSYKLADDVKAQASEAYVEFKKITEESIANGLFRNYPVDYLAALLESQTVMAVQLISQNPEKLSEYQKIGFDILWNGITR